MELSVEKVSSNITEKNLINSCKETVFAFEILSHGLGFCFDSYLFLRPTPLIEIVKDM